MITAAIITYILVMVLYVGPTIVNQVYGQPFNPTQSFSAFDNQQYQQPYQDPYNQGYQQQYGYQQPYQDPYQQYGTPYQQYPTPYQQPYGMQQNPIQFGTSEIIYTLLGGAGIGYGRYNQQKRNQDKEVQRELMAALLQEKQEKRELARVSYAKMPQQGNEIVDAPSIQLQKLDKDINDFADKVAKA